MPKVYFNRVKNECFKTISCMCSVNSWKKVKVKLLSHVWLFATLWTVAHQAPRSVGFSRHEYGSGLPFPSPGNLPDPGIEPRSPVLQADALTSKPPGKPRVTIRIGKEEIQFSPSWQLSLWLTSEFWDKLLSAQLIHHLSCLSLQNVCYIITYSLMERTTCYDIFIY